MTNILVYSIRILLSHMLESFRFHRNYIIVNENYYLDIINIFKIKTLVCESEGGNNLFVWLVANFITRYNLIEQRFILILGVTCVS